jgi:hypothetical protein
MWSGRRFGSSFKTGRKSEISGVTAAPRRPSTATVSSSGPAGTGIIVSSSS